MNHVSAFNESKSPSAITHIPPQLSPHSSHPSIILKYSKLNSLCPTSPIFCKRFRVNIIMSKLKSHFRDCWSHEKSSSIKLNLFYDSYKKSFVKEPYLDLVTNPAYKFRTTRLRISAHDLHIESGRYTKTPREERTCKWCELTLGEKLLEDESHFLFSCDLYSKLRQKMMSTLTNTPSYLQSCLNNLQLEASDNINLGKVHRDISSVLLAPADITIHSLSLIFRLLFPSCIPEDQSFDTELGSNISNLAYYIHPHPLNTNNNRTDYTKEQQIISNKLWSNIRTYTLNTLSTFVGRCFDERWKFQKQLKLKTRTDNNATDPLALSNNLGANTKSHIAT